MGKQIIRQPSGKYAVWSSIVDHFVVVGATPQEIENYYAEQVCSRAEAKEHVSETISRLDNGGEPYHQFTKSWDEALAWIFCVHGGNSREGTLRWLIETYLGNGLEIADIECVRNGDSGFWKRVVAFHQDVISDTVKDAERKGKLGKGDKA